MQCSKETIARLFYNVSSSFTLLFFFFHFTSIFLSMIFCFLGGNLFFPRNQDEYEFGEFSDEEVGEEHEQYHAESMQKDHLVADIVGEGQNLMFSHIESSDHEDDRVESGQDEPFDGEGQESYDSDRMSVYSSPALDSTQRERVFLQCYIRK